MEQYKLYLNGEWTDSRLRFSVTDPGMGEAFAEVPAATREQARKAIGDAHQAFSTWRSLTGMRRGDYLLDVARALTERKEEIARLITRVNGKPLAQ